MQKIVFTIAVFLLLLSGACRKNDIGDLNLILNEISQRKSHIDSWNFVSYFGSREVDIKRTNIFLGFDVHTPSEIVEKTKNDTMIELIKMGYKDIQVYGVYRWNNLISVPKQDLISLSFEYLDRLANCTAMLEEEYKEDNLKIILETNENEQDNLITVYYCLRRSPTEVEQNNILAKIIMPFEKLNYTINND